MNVVITKDFLEYECLFSKNSFVQELIKEYTKVAFHVNFSLMEVYDENSYLQIFKSAVELDNEFFEVSNFETYTTSDIQNLTSCRGLIIFKTENEKLHESLRNEDFVFDYENLNEKYNEVQSRLDFRIDLSENNYPEMIKIRFQELKTIPFDTLILKDPYILKNEALDDLIYILKTTVFKASHISNILIIAKFSVLNNGNRNVRVEKELKKVYSKLHSVFSEYKIQFYFIDADIMKSYSSLDIHDRLMYHPYWVLESGKGFDVFNKVKNYDSKIESNSFFDRFTYKRKVNHLHHIQKFIDKVFEHKIMSQDQIIFPCLKERLKLIY